MRKTLRYLFPFVLNYLRTMAETTIMCGACILMHVVDYLLFTFFDLPLNYFLVPGIVTLVFLYFALTPFPQVWQWLSGILVSLMFIARFSGYFLILKLSRG